MRRPPGIRRNGVKSENVYAFIIDSPAQNSLVGHYPSIGTRRGARVPYLFSFRATRDEGRFYGLIAKLSAILRPGEGGEKDFRELFGIYIN